MARRTEDDDGVAVPSGRLNRLARLAGVATTIGADMVGGRLRAAASGRNVDMRTLALSPANALRLTRELAQMRGAAMKVGQLLSMDAGELLPPEFAEVLARLRADARPMPPQQLKTVLDRAWGPGWLKRFQSFEPRPLAAASIGQVHRARTRDGRDLAIKVQFPGVRESIDSDVDNIGSLIRLSGILPDRLALGPLLDAAKAQLREEADYLAEADALADFRTALDDAPEFLIPAPAPDLIRPDVLAMDFIPSEPLESLVDASQAVRDEAATRLFALLFREVFALGRMQSDPNLANYRHDPETGRLVLLDFGAVRHLPDALVEGYRRLLRAGMQSDSAALEAAAREIGYLENATPHEQVALLVPMLAAATEPLRVPGAFDFATTDLAQRMRDDGMVLGLDAGYRHLPPIDALYLHRKFGGLYLLARRLRAKVDIRGLLTPYL